MIAANKFSQLEERCDPACPGWQLVNEWSEPEIQRCDACWEDVADPLTDMEALELPDARTALEAALTTLMHHRARARTRRRMVIVREDDVKISPCCGQGVRVIERVEETRRLVVLRLIEADKVTPFLVDGSLLDEHRSYEVACVACMRFLNLPAGYVINKHGEVES